MHSVNNSCSMYLVVVPEPISVPQSRGGRVARDLHNKQYESCTDWAALLMTQITLRSSLESAIY